MGKQKVVPRTMTFQCPIEMRVMLLNISIMLLKHDGEIVSESELIRMAVSDPIGYQKIWKRYIKGY